MQTTLDLKFWTSIISMYCSQKYKIQFASVTEKQNVASALTS